MFSSKIVAFIALFAAAADAAAPICADQCATLLPGKDPCGRTPYGCQYMDRYGTYFYCQVGGNANDGTNDGCNYEDVPGTKDPSEWCLFKSPEIEPFENCESGGNGDPHIKTWTNEYFDYMGECDLVFAHVPKISGEVDLDIHGRTTIQDFYSYIETVAVKLGDDILEVSSWGEYSVNGVENADVNPNADVGKLRKSHKVTTLGGFPIYHTQLNKKKHEFDIVLSPKVNITVSSVKGIVGVQVNRDSTDMFDNTEGLFGNIEGKFMARDGVTKMHDDINAFAQEWQVRDTDPKLFTTARGPQYPQKCRLPNLEEKEARRLGEGITEEQAAEACAHLKDDAIAFKNCVYDVTATNDLELADGAGAF